MSRLPKISAKDREMLGLFSQITDPTKADPEVIEIKFPDVISNLKQVVSLLRKLGKCNAAPLCPEFPFSDFETQAQRIEENIFDGPHTPENWIRYKDSLAVQQAIMMCSFIAPYKNSLNDPDDNWIKRITMGTRLFSFSNFDIYMFWNNKKLTNDHLKYMLISIRLLYELCYEIYDNVTSPDMDINDFADCLLGSLNQIQKHPQLCRCKRAFALIRDNTNMFKNNFSNYYRDYLQSLNPSIIVENFIIDVSQKNSSSASPAVANEFMRIIRVIKTSLDKSNSIAGPKLNDLYNTLNKHIDTMRSAKPYDPNPEPEA